jgi:hypothetical protein
MAKLNNWLRDIEAMEERLEGMKLIIWPSLSKGHESIVRSTAGLLKGRIRSGVAYQRRIRQDWKASIE